MEIPDDSHFSIVDQSQKLCELCSSMSIGKLRSPVGFEHHDDAYKLKEESERKNGCALCSLMWASLQDSLKSSFMCEYFEERPNKPNDPQTFLSRTLMQTHVKLFLNLKNQFDDDRIRDFQVFCGPQSDLNSLQWLGPKQGYGLPEAVFSLVPSALTYDAFDYHGIRGSFRIAVEISSPVADHFAYKIVHDTATSDGAFHMIQRWLVTCQISNCGWEDEESRYLPTRIIDVGPADGSEDPILAITKPSQSITDNKEDTRYIALSYCWGLATDTPFTTTTSMNLESRKRGVPMSELPRVFQDAVTITRKLGIRFLWIDSLCILQGHDNSAKVDWATESSKMTEVYGGAYLTIAAASASNVHEGILIRERRADRNFELNLRSHSQPEQAHRVFIGPKPTFCQSMDEPLYRRGWTLQERILSPRVLICNRDQFAWECQCRNETESGGHMNSLSVMRLDKRCKSQKEAGLTGFTSSWQCIVTDYSARSLTQPNDKLPAIAGLARKFSEFHGQVGGRYLAGVWENSLLDDMLWGHWSIDIGAKPARCRPASYRAPSWSWASVDGNVRWPLADDNGEGPYLVEIIKVHCDTVGEDIFGCVTSGFVKLRGGLKKIDRLAIQEPDQDHGYENSAVLTIAEFESETLRFDCTCLDMSIEEDEYEMEVRAKRTGDPEVWLLPIKESGALILGRERAGSGLTGNVFRRLGAIFDLDFPYSDNYEEGGIFHGLEREEFTLL